MQRTPRRRKPETINPDDFFKELAEKLSLQADEPNILGFEPLIKQEIFLRSEKLKKLYAGGNRSGKTTVGIVEDIDWMAGTNRYKRTPDPPVRGRIVGVDVEEGINKILLPTFSRWCPPSYLRGGSFYSAYDLSARTLYFENGSFAEFMSYEQDVQKFVGTSRHFVHFDEEPPQEIYIECLARLIDTDGAWWMTLTPILGMQWMYDEIYLPNFENPDGDVEVQVVEMWENTKLSDRAIQSFIDSIPEEDRDTRVGGNFIRRGGVIYKKFKKSVHVIDEINLDDVKDWDLYASVDHGYNNPTAWHWHVVSPDGEVITFAEHYEREMTIDQHAAIVKMMEATFGRTPVMRVCDPALAQKNPVTGTSVQAEYITHGIEVMHGINDVTTGINKVNSYINYNDETPPRWHVTRNCENLIKEMPKYRWKTWANKTMERQNNAYDVPHKKDDHAMDGLRYFFTVMPELKAIVETPVQEERQPTTADYQQYPARYDESLRRQLAGVGKNSDGWTVTNADEYMGGEW